MITIGAGSVRRVAVVRTVLLTTLLLGAVPVYAASVTGTKTVTGPFYPGGAIIYTVTLTNAGGPQGDNNGAEFIDPLPASLIMVSASASSGVATVAGNTVTWDGSLPDSTPVTITINATIAMSTALGTAVANQGTIIFDSDGNGTNESAVSTDDPGVPGPANPTSFTVTSPATVTGIKTVSGPFYPGATITYTIVLTNSGPATQFDNPTSEFVDTLPADVSGLTATATSGVVAGEGPPNVVGWNGSLAPGASVTITITALILPTTPGTVVVNQGTAHFDADGDGTNEATALTDDPTVAGADNPTSFTVTSPATVTATKTVTGTFTPGGAITYTVVLTNAGPATQVDNPGDEFTDTLPASLTLVSATASGGTAVATVGTRTVTWNGSLANAATVTITITATIAASTVPGTVSNQGTVSFDADGDLTNEATALTDDPDVAGAADATSFTVTSPATVTGTKTVSGPFYPGGLVTYTVVLTNAGPSTQFDNAGDEFTDILPASLTLVSATASSGTAVATAGTGTVTWNGSLANGATVTITITATIVAPAAPGTTVSNQGTARFDADGDGTNEASALTDDPTVAGPADPTRFTVTSPATVTGTKTVTGQFYPGGLVTYTVVLSNAGPSTQSDNPGDEFTDTLSASLTLVSATASSGTAVATVGTGTVTWNGSLANGATVTITITATIVAPTTLGTTVSNQGTANYDADGNGTNEASALTDDPGVAGPADLTSFTVTSPATITATKTVTGTFNPGGAVTYAVVLSNAGPSAQTDNTGDEFTDTLPASLILVSASATSGTAVATVGTRTVTWNGSLANGATVTITITATIVAPTALGATVSNQGTASYDADGNGSNEATALTDDPAVGGANNPTSFTVTSPATVAATKTVTGTFIPGGAITYTVVLTNAGPATQVDNPGNEFTDTLPASLILVSASATSGTAVATVGTRTVTWSGSLANGASVTITITATIAASTVPGTVSNQGTASFDADGNGTNEATVLTDDPGVAGPSNPTTFTVGSPATVTGTKTVTGTFNRGGAVTYTVVLSNAGPSAQADNAGNEFTDVLPASLTLVSATASSGTAVATVGTRTVTWNGSLANGASVTITISARIAASTAPGTAVANQGTASFDADGNGTNEATALTDDPTVAGAADPTTFTTSTEPALTATKTVAGTFTQRGTITYTIVISNRGSLTQADNTGNEFTDVLPASLTLVSATASSGTAVATVSTNTVTWNGSMAPGVSITITIGATIGTSTVGGTVVTNQGTIRFDADDDGTNESSALTDDPATPTAGDPTSFTVVGSVPFIALNGDGLGDVLLYNVLTGAGSSQVNDGSGGFTATFEAWDAGWKVFPLDLNHDAYTDIFFYNPVNGSWVQALNTGSGGFTYTAGSWDPAWNVYPADLDGDALTDLFLYNASTGVWVKSFVDGTGNFANYSAGTWDPAWTLTPGDLNGDGRADFFLYNASNGVWVKALSQAGVGTFDYPASGQWDPGWQLSAADLDGDHLTDLVLYNAAGVHVSARSRADGGFDYPAVGQWDAGWTIAPGDLDGDGRTDLFLYDARTGIWQEAYSDGAGDFTYAGGQWDAGWTVGVTDFDGDGRADILVSNVTGVWVRATNTGTGTFTYTAGNWGAGWTVFSQRPSVR